MDTPDALAGNVVAGTVIPHEADGAARDASGTAAINVTKTEIARRILCLRGAATAKSVHFITPP
jgi:hypothetical protein